MWQPIDTAPEGDSENGPFFDVIWANVSHEYLPIPKRHIDCYRHGELIFRKHGYPSVTTVFTNPPTHWMVRVEPPQ